MAEFNTGAREKVLAKVRAAQVKAFIPEPPAGLPARMVYPRMDLPGLKARLMQELELLGVETYLEANDEDVRARVKKLIAGKAVLAWDKDQLPCGTGACLDGEKVYTAADPKEEQGKADIGLTGVEAAIAETGSFVMQAGPGRPRTASLLPYLHVAVIRGSDILLGMGEFFDRAKAKGGLLPYFVFATGPSRTADIELSLTLGVHGPGHVYAVIAP
jgi:L-lactate dehydrogenase complex protein LldG